MQRHVKGVPNQALVESTSVKDSNSENVKGSNGHTLTSKYVKEPVLPFCFKKCSAGVFKNITECSISYPPFSLTLRVFCNLQYEDKKSVSGKLGEKKKKKHVTSAARSRAWVELMLVLQADCSQGQTVVF